MLLTELQRKGADSRTHSRPLTTTDDLSADCKWASNQEVRKRPEPPKKTSPNLHTSDTNEAAMEENGEASSELERYAMHRLKQGRPRYIPSRKATKNVSEGLPLLDHTFDQKSSTKPILPNLSCQLIGIHVEKRRCQNRSGSPTANHYHQSRAPLL